GKGGAIRKLFGRHKQRISEFRLQSQARLTKITFRCSHQATAWLPVRVSISSRRLEVGGFMVAIENNGVFGKFPERFQKCCITRVSAV
ncbi:MAG: hypothetical protein WA645_17670, partial [Pseudolabrys sp.]